jgi:(p)ppGpp synthase/HD superfamily hydrolase
MFGQRFLGVPTRHGSCRDEYGTLPPTHQGSGSFLLARRDDHGCREVDGANGNTFENHQFLMNDQERLALERLVLAPYLQKATALIGRRRQVGGNQFRHAMATLAILIDYHFTDAVLLKAAVIHDLVEEVPSTDLREIRSLDADGEGVVRLVIEVTRGAESKREYLKRIRDHGSNRAKTLKVADRISNLTDLHMVVFEEEFVARYLTETREFIYPIALEINAQMAHEVQDLIDRRRRALPGAHGHLLRDMELDLP